MEETITFSIEERTYPTFKEGSAGKPFSSVVPEDFISEEYGAAYEGPFKLRYPTLRDRAGIVAKQMEILRTAGFSEDMLVTADIRDQTYALAAVDVLGLEKPAWFSDDTPASDIYQRAVIEVGVVLRERLASKKNEP